MTARRLVSLVAALAAAAILTSGCGAVERPTTAAVVDGRVITTGELTRTAEQLDAAKVLAQPATETDVLNWLILAGFIERQTAASGSWSPDDKYYAVAAQVAAPTDATLEYLKARVAVSSLTSADRDAILAKLGAAQITVNPQFGRFDPADGGLKTVNAPWIKPAPAPTA